MNELPEIIENSFLAFMARKKLKSSNVAMVIGKKIYLSGVTKSNFLKNEKWVRHELVHVEQFKRYGFYKFLFLYFVESIKMGYYKNKFEVEARQKAEQE